MKIEYAVKLFSVNYTEGSVGWQNVSERPHNKAAEWMNEMGQEGFELDKFIVHRPTDIYVIMSRQIAILEV